MQGGRRRLVTSVGYGARGIGKRKACSANVEGLFITGCGDWLRKNYFYYYFMCMSIM